MIRLLPDFEEDLFLELFQKSAHDTWTSRDLDWSLPFQLSPRQMQALARMLTPVYLGEQTAMLGAGRMLTQFMEAGETTAQIYVASFIMDEARHFEALTRLYRHLGQSPLSVRAMPEMLRFHHRLRQGDRVDWTWGILISDLFAKLFYRWFARSQPEALFGRMATRILQDESRHQAFAMHYLSRNVPKLMPERRRALLATRDEILHLLPLGVDRVRADCEALGFDGDRFVAELTAELEQASRRIGLDEPEPPAAPPPVAPAHMAPCFGCLLAALCQPALA